MRGPSGIVVVFVVTTAACGGDSGDAAAAARPPDGVAPSEYATARGGERAPATPVARAVFDVEGMTCGGCVLATRKALSKLPGVLSADASYDEKTGGGAAWAAYDPALVTPERMMAAIRELGYKPTPRRAE